MSLRSLKCHVYLLRLPLVWLAILGSASAQTHYEQAKLLASDGATGDYFGCSVSLSGDTAIVGAQADVFGPYSNRLGSAYVFVRNGMRWTEQSKLTASDAAGGSHSGLSDMFGTSVSLEGDTVLIGARGDDYWYGPPYELRIDSGSAYVFVRSGATWTQQAMLVASDGNAGELLGESVSLSSDTAIAGAPRGAAGAAYVFVRSGTTWTEQAKLVASDGLPGDSFGHYVSLSGDTVVVSAKYNSFGYDAGSAYVFVRMGTTWTEEAKLVPIDVAVGDGFGDSLSLSGDTVLIGAPFDDLSGTSDDNMGSAYVFVRSGTTWTEQAKLVASDGAAHDLFGNSVSLSGDTAVISKNRGPTYVFVRNGTTWTEASSLVIAGVEAGASVSLSGDAVVIGAEPDSGCAYNEGSAYVFGPQPGLPYPHLTAVDPTSTPALVPGTAQTITLMGTGFDFLTGLLLDCVPIDPARYTIVSPTLITLDMPQAPRLGNNYIGVTDGFYTNSVQIWIGAPITPVYQLGNGEPLNVIDRDDGFSLILSGPVGRAQYLYVSPSSVPSSNPFVRLDMGNDFTELFNGGRYVVPASGWLQVNFPGTAIPDPGPAGMVLYSQTLRPALPFPVPVSNLQSITLVQ